MNNKITNEINKISDCLNNSTFLITGSTGMIGQNVVNLLLSLNESNKCNIKILAHARNKDKAERLFNKIHSHNFSTVICDITDLSINENIDYIIHTAGVTGGSKQHVDFPMRTISTALDGTRKVLDLAVENNVKGLVYLSTLEVYGNSGFDKQEIFETDGGYIDTTNVRSSYSESKRMCECMCASYTKQYNIPTYIARLTSTFGYGVAYTDKRVFAQFARSVIEKNDIVLKSTGETVRNYCDAEDAATAFLYLLVKGAPGEAYNIANMNTEISIKDLAAKFIENYPESNISLKFDLNADAAKLGYNAVMKNVLNSNKLMSLGWEPKYNMDDMIKRLIDTMKRSLSEEV